MKRGFTLIEQLAALALATALVVATLAIFSRIAPHPAATAAPRDGPDFQRVAELIERDLADSCRVNSRQDTAQLSGFASLDPSTGLPDHRPVRITYFIERGEQGARLIRQQRRLDLLSNHDTWSELAGDRIESFTLVPLTIPPPAARAATDAFGPDSGDEVCRSYRLVLRGEGGATSLDQVLSVR